MNLDEKIKKDIEFLKLNKRKPGDTFTEYRNGEKWEFKCMVGSEQLIELGNNMSSRSKCFLSKIMSLFGL